MRRNREKGVALITALLILFLVSAIVVGMSWMVLTDQRLGGNNKDRENAFYGAEAGMEKMTADVGTTFATKGAITAADITTVTGAPPAIAGIQFLNALGLSTYQITPLVPVSSNATVLPPSPYSGMQALITPLTLTVAAQTTTTGAEVKLQRQIQVVAIPVFQFGIYSDSDLAYFNGPPFDFGGRVHTNGNLWLAANAGPLFLADKVTVVGQVIRTNLENGWPGGGAIGAGGDYSGAVSIALTPNPATEPAGPTYTNAQWRALALTEGSVTAPSVYGGVSTALNNPTWNGTVVPAYNGQLANGVPVLSLTSTALGGITVPISLIRRAVPGELASNPAEFSQQLFTEATLRILLDDYATPGVPASGCANSDMMKLDGIDTSTPPVDLATLGSTSGAPSWWAANSAQTFYPLPISGTASVSSYTVYNVATVGTGDGYWVTKNNPIITGCIKIEYQNTGNSFHDITEKILGLGFTGRNINPQNTAGGSYVAPPKLTPIITGTEIAAQGPTTGAATISCTDPSPTAIIRIARFRDNPSVPGANFCGVAAGAPGSDFWPLALFDSREGGYRPGVALGGSPSRDGLQEIPALGVMYYIELDAANLAAWLKNNQAGLALDNNTGFTVYFSDRRGEQLDPNASSTRTGSFGFNDITNGGDAANGCPNKALDAGEDLEGDGILRTYGATPTTIPNLLTGALPNPVTTGPLPSPTTGTMAVVQNPNCTANYTTLWPGAGYVHTQEARENPAIFFRRALKIVDGATLNLGTSCYGAAPNPPCGLTIASENPVYIQGDYNAPGGSLTGAGTVAASVAADAVTLLSDNWNDVNAFADPYDLSNRVAVQTSYRVALIGGKGIPFAQPAGEPEDFGTDGGLHNFLRFLENWGGINCNYEGSLVSFYYNRQGVGTYKTGNTVYSPPNRNYTFDSNFTLGPQWLPPNTPVLRSINTIGFTQMLMPTQ